MAKSNKLLNDTEQVLLQQSNRLLQINCIHNNLHQLGKRHLLDEHTNVLVYLIRDKAVGRLANHIVQLGLTRVQTVRELLTVVHKLLDLNEDLGHARTIGQSIVIRLADVSRWHVNLTRELDTLPPIIRLCAALNAAVVVLGKDLLNPVVTLVEEDLVQSCSIRLLL